MAPSQPTAVPDAAHVCSVVFAELSLLNNHSVAGSFQVLYRGELSSFPLGTSKVSILLLWRPRWGTGNSPETTPQEAAKPKSKTQVASSRVDAAVPRQCGLRLLVEHFHLLVEFF